MRSRWMVSAVLAAAVLGGCNKDETATPTNPGGAATKPTSAPMGGLTMPAGMDAAAADATKKLTEIQTYLGDKKYDMADKGLKELEDRKASLPAQVASALPALRSAVDAGKMKGMVPTTMPSGMRMPTTTPSTSGVPALPG